MNVPSIVKDIPVPGAGIIADVISFLGSFVKGKTTHATLAQVNPQEQKFRAAITEAFQDYSTEEKTAIAQKAVPLLVSAMQTRWGLVAQGQPALASYVQTSGLSSLENIGGAMFSWIAVNVDAASAQEATAVMQWAWQFVFVSGMQQAGIDTARIATVSNPTLLGGGGVPVTTAGFSGVLVVLLLIGVVIGVARKKR